MISETDKAVVLPGETMFYLFRDNQTFGPHSVEEIEAFLDSGDVLRDHFLWTEGMEQWVSIGLLFRTAAPPDIESAAIAPSKSSDGAVSFPEIVQIARAGRDGLSRRLSIAAAVAIGLHVVLLVSLTLGAATFFKINETVAIAPTPQEPPMDVTLVTEEDPPPPADTPPPPDDPPPPPALPDIPLPTVMLPPTPVPVTMPAPETPTLAPPAPLPVVAAPPVPKAVKVRHAAPVVAPQQSAEVTDASPSDYLTAPPPSYPYQARLARQEGTVILLVVINAEGDPVNVSVAESSGYPVLDTVARRQVSDRFRFKVGNSRVLRIPINFRL